MDVISVLSSSQSETNTRIIDAGNVWKRNFPSKMYLLWIFAIKNRRNTSCTTLCSLLFELWSSPEYRFLAMFALKARWDAVVSKNRSTYEKVMTIVYGFGLLFQNSCVKKTRHLQKDSLCEMRCVPSWTPSTLPPVLSSPPTREIEPSRLFFYRSKRLNSSISAMKRFVQTERMALALNGEMNGGMRILFIPSFSIA